MVIIMLHIYSSVGLGSVWFGSVQLNLVCCEHLLLSLFLLASLSFSRLLFLPLNSNQLPRRRNTRNCFISWLMILFSFEGAIFCWTNDTRLLILCVRESECAAITPVFKAFNTTDLGSIYYARNFNRLCPLN